MFLILIKNPYKIYIESIAEILSSWHFDVLCQNFSLKILSKIVIYGSRRVGKSQRHFVKSDILLLTSIHKTCKNYIR